MSNKWKKVESAGELSNNFLAFIVFKIASDLGYSIYKTFGKDHAVEWRIERKYRS